MYKYYSSTHIVIKVYFIGTATPKLHELFEKVTPNFVSYWKDIGVFLKIPPEDLRVIDKDVPGNCRECCNRMLDIWLETTPSASWSKLAEAVESAVKPERKEI